MGDVYSLIHSSSLFLNLFPSKFSQPFDFLIFQVGRSVYVVFYAILKGLEGRI